MPELTIGDLCRVLVESAGETEGLAVGDSAHEQTFEELGYDSLALLETAARLKQEYGIDLSDDAVLDAKTPGALLALARNSARKGAYR
ncbi:acyl carrier protein [Amycolatopsis sp. H6(2020)]|nr:acyl carrier protein [Amycolatopsis sp. H6(2020)]